MTTQAAFLQQVSELVADGLAKLFGHKLFSVKSLATCLCFLIASKYLSVELFQKEQLPFVSKPLLLVLSLVFLTLGFSVKLRYLSFVVLAFGFFFVLKGTIKEYQQSFPEVISTTLVYVAGILGVMGFVALTRWSLRLGSRLSDTPSLSAIVLFNVALGAGLLGPFIYTEFHYHVTTLGPRVGTIISRPFGFQMFL